MFGRVVNMESPEKKPTSSKSVKRRVRLRAARYLQEEQEKRRHIIH